MSQFFFWTSSAILFYSIIGYGFLLCLLVGIKKFFVKSPSFDGSFEPSVAMVVPCYNEAEVLDEKVQNCLQLDYPKDKLAFIFITDGSDDNTADVLRKYREVSVLHSMRRSGKAVAENRAMQHVDLPIVIFSDANTLLNKDAVKNIVRHFEAEDVGCVSGEKRILKATKEVASAAGEGLYWQYESFLKRLESELYSVVGAAGELVAFRTPLFEDMPEDTILDDFIQSMLIASKGYKIVYEPGAYATEATAASIKEELKRKIRICAGGWQSINRLSKRFTPMSSPLFYFQYFSHRILRWTVNPFLLPLIFFSNFMLAAGDHFYFATLILQLVFYLFSFAGFLFGQQRMKMKVFFLPYYFCIMNYAAVMGMVRYLKGSQSAVWEKNARLKTSLTS